MKDFGFGRRTGDEKRESCKYLGTFFQGNPLKRANVMVMQGLKCPLEVPEQIVTASTIPTP